jgi:hypothetical protein
MRLRTPAENQMCETGAAGRCGHPLAPHLLPRHLDARSAGRDALVADALVLPQ